MKRFGFLIFLLVLAVIESAIPLHLNLIAVLILLNFVPFSFLVWRILIVGLFLDLLLGNFLGVNSLIMIGLILIFNFLKNFLWSNLSYEIFPRQTIFLTILAVILASPLYDFFYNFMSFNILSFNFDLRLIPSQILVTLIFYPVISYLSLQFAPKKQLELKF